MIAGYESFVVAAIVGLLTVMAGMFMAMVEMVSFDEVEKQKKMENTKRYGKIAPDV